MRSLIDIQELSVNEIDELIAVANDNAKTDAPTIEFAVADITAPKAGNVTLVQEYANDIRISMANFSDNVSVEKYKISIDGEKVVEF